MTLDQLASPVIILHQNPPHLASPRECASDPASLPGRGSAALTGLGSGPRIQAGLSCSLCSSGTSRALVCSPHEYEGARGQLCKGLWDSARTPLLASWGRLGTAAFPNKEQQRHSVRREGLGVLASRKRGAREEGPIVTGSCVPTGPVGGS